MALINGYVALGTGMGPGYTFTELLGGSYARQALNLVGTITAGGTQSLSAFGAATLPSTGVIRNGAIFDAATGGNLVAYWDWVPAQTLPTVAFPAATLLITMTPTIVATAAFSTAVFQAGVQIGLVNGQPMIAGNNVVQRGGVFVASVNETITQPAQQNLVVGNLRASGLITESAATGLVANVAGTQAAATPLLLQTNQIGTAANAVAPFASVLLPVSNAGLEITVVNTGANPVTVFGQGTDTINGVAASSGVLQMQNSVDTYWSPVSGMWFAELGGGFSGPFITENAQDTISAAGATQAAATQIITQTSRVSTVGAATGGVYPGIRLPMSAAGLELIVINHGANPMQVYGLGTDTIDDIATAVGVQQMVNSMCIYTCATAGNWYSNGIGTGYAGQFPTVSYSNGITAFAGGGQSGPTAANGALVGTAIFRVTTVATSADSVRLPIAAGGMQVTVTNAGSNSLAIFPGVGDNINGAGVNVVYSLAATKTTQFSSAVAGQWHAVLSA